jgi:hypothetical protein
VHPPTNFPHLSKLPEDVSWFICSSRVAVRTVFGVSFQISDLQIAMNEEFLKKIIVTAIALLGLISWMVLAHVEPKEECLNNCPTDFSANRR